MQTGMESLMPNELAPYHGDPEHDRERTPRPEVIRLLAPMFALWPQHKIPEATYHAYADRLCSLPAESLQRAILHCMDNCKSLPTVADIMDAWKQRTAPGPRTDLTVEQIVALPDWPPPDSHLYRQSDDERKQRLQRTKKWGYRYGD